LFGGTKTNKAPRGDGTVVNPVSYGR